MYIPRKNKSINDPFGNNPFLDKKPERVLDPDAPDFNEKTDELLENGGDEEVEDVVQELLLTFGIIAALILSPFLTLILFI